MHVPVQSRFVPIENIRNMIDLEQPEMTGILTKNRTAGPADPPYVGEICIAGVVYQIEGTVAEGPRGKFFELIVIAPDGMAPTAVTPGHYPEVVKPGGRRKPMQGRDVIPF